MNKRMPLIVLAAAVVLCLIAYFLLVSPEMGKVSAANSDLDKAIGDQASLTTQIGVLTNDKDNAASYQATIDQVDQQIPPQIDLASIFVLLQGAAAQSGVDAMQITVGTPVLSTTTGISSVDVGVSATGTYFTLTELSYKLQNLQRATTMTGLSLAPAGAAVVAGQPVPLTLTTTVQFFTFDTSSGPLSDPGSQPPAGAVGPTIAPSAVPSASPSPGGP